MKTDRIVLDKAEADWFSRNILKTITMLEARADKEPEILDRKTYKVCKSLAEQATQIADILTQLGDEHYVVEVQAKPKQRSGVTAILEMTIRALEEQVIPAYQKKGDTLYEEATKAKVTLLKTMKRKFK